MFNFNVVSPAVLVDAVGRPREIRAAGQRLAVTGLESVRQETAAYPLGVGPRRVFVVEAARRRYRLVHLLRDRRWTVEELASVRPDLAAAA
jgi:ABC-type Fe3+-hydroxamate transport system substrate-binding protein